MEKYIPRLRKHYADNVVPALQKQFNFKSSMQVPRLEKIAINQGVGAATADKKLIETALAETRGRVGGPTGAAAKLGIPRQTLESKIKMLGINKFRFKTP